MLWMTVRVVGAKITNDALDPMIGYNAADAQSGQLFVNYFIYIWNVLMLVGGLVVLLFFVQAAIEWITAGGDSGKITKARDRMLQSTIGLVILVFSFVIVSFISALLFDGTGFNLLNMTFNSPGLP
jgi:hypothetical protein